MREHSLRVSPGLIKVSRRGLNKKKTRNLGVSWWRADAANSFPLLAHFTGKEGKSLSPKRPSLCIADSGIAATGNHFGPDRRENRRRCFFPSALFAPGKQLLREENKFHFVERRGAVRARVSSTARSVINKLNGSRARDEERDSGPQFVRQIGNCFGFDGVSSAAR